MIAGRPDRIRWLPLLVLVINVAVLGLFVAYSSLNLRPDMPRVVPWETFRRWIAATGPVTNLAARLGDRADGGQIFLDAATPSVPATVSRSAASAGSP